MNIILTEHGRKLLSQGDLRVKYYAFADDEVDYQALNGTLLSTDTVQNVDNFFYSIGQNPPDYMPLTANIPYIAPTASAFDPSTISNMAFWWDERTFAPDGATANTIELDSGSNKAYSELLNVAYTGLEQSRYFGQPYTAFRPRLSSSNGWRAPHFHHLDSGSSGTYIRQINFNNVETTKVGVMGTFMTSSMTGYTAFGVAKIPQTLNVGENYILMCSAGATWEMYMLPDVGDHIYCYIFHQGKLSGSKSTFIDLRSGNFANTGSLLSFGAWWDGSTVQIEAVRSDGTFASSAPSTQVDALFETDSNAYRLNIGGSSGLGSWDGPIFSLGICQRLMPQTERRNIMLSGVIKYNTVTSSVWPDGPTPIDPLTLYPTQLWAPGNFSITGNLISSVDNAGSNGANKLFASGSQRPITGSIGSLTACVTSGSNWLELSGANESTVLGSGSAWTIIGAVIAKTQSIGYPSTPTIYAGSSSLATPMMYNPSLNRFVTQYVMSGGTHGNLGIITMVDNWIQGQPLVWCTTLDPNNNFDGYGTIRGITNGEQQSDYGGPISASMTGSVQFGKHLTNVLDTTWTPPYIWSKTLTYKEIQGVRRMLSISGGLVNPPVINPNWQIYYSSGSFSNPTKRYYLINSPTTGSPAFMTSSVANQITVEYRGDFSGTLIEGQRINLVDFSRTFLGGNWSTGLATVTQNDVPGPDSFLSGTRFSGNAGQYGNFENIITPANIRTATSAWARSKSGTSTIPWDYEATNTDGGGSYWNLSTTYQRIDVEITGGNKFIIADGRDTSTIGGHVAASFDGDLDFVQLEAEPFPSSFIYTSGSALTRSADILTIASGVIDSRLFTTKGQFDQISPVFSNIDLISASLGIASPIQNYEYWLLNFSSSNLDGIRIIYDGTKVIAQVLSHSNVLATSSNLIFNRHSLLGPMIWDPPNGTLAFSGTTFASSSWTWPNTNIRIGGIYGRLSESFCRFGNLTNA